MKYVKVMSAWSAIHTKTILSTEDEEDDHQRDFTKLSLLTIVRMVKGWTK